VIKIHINADDRYLLRFAFSPSYEIVSSFNVLRDPTRHTLHMTWAAETRRALGEMDLSLLDALIPPKRYIPDFITPLPAVPAPTIEDEIEVMLKTPHDVVRHDLMMTLEHAPERRDQLQPFLDRPAVWLSKLAKLMTQYWRKALAPHWPRMRTVLEGDLLTRARALALNGPEAVLGHLHPLIRYQDGTLLVDKPWDQQVSTGGDGLLLVPSTFVAPHFLLFLDTPPTPVVIYGARGVGTLWLGEGAQRHSSASAGLQELLGKTRADVLMALESPMTTAQLAGRFTLTAGAVSQHLGALKRAGTVETHRQGRSAFHRLTPAGESLVRIFA
jgi:DNA-binding transcriptional ArsR family regulator